ncbi:flagellar hook protein FlgE [Nitrospira defluvii]|nr:flagellar hook protein FlgE [Nitrospira defluvii]
MSILTSLFSGISGLNAFGNALSVVSSNIANLNTNGYKSSRVTFSDIISSTDASTGGQVGRGVLINNISSDFSQGSFETSGNILDMAVEGDGFFILKNSEGAEFYSRAGVFSISKDGLVQNPEGLLLQGMQFDTSGVPTGVVGAIDLSSANIPPISTAEISMIANLDSSAAVQTFAVATPSATSNFSTSMTVFDSFGADHQVNIYFSKTINASTGNTWTFNAVVDAADATAGTATIMATGTLLFGTDGTLQNEGAVSFPTGGFDFAGGPDQNQIIAFDFGTNVISENGTGLDGITQFGSASAVLNQSQDGTSDGGLQSISLGQDGKLTGQFSNGRSRTMAQVQIARFNNTQGLEKRGDNTFISTNASAQPTSGNPQTSGRGKILGNSLELSNVDLADQFVRMIEYQRGFQANSRVITTTDDLLNELVNLRR